MFEGGERFGRCQRVGARAHAQPTGAGVEIEVARLAEGDGAPDAHAMLPAPADREPEERVHGRERHGVAWAFLILRFGILAMIATTRWLGGPSAGGNRSSSDRLPLVVPCPEY